MAAAVAIAGPHNLRPVVPSPRLAEFSLGVGTGKGAGKGIGVKGVPAKGGVMEGVLVAKEEGKGGSGGGGGGGATSRGKGEGMVKGSADPAIRQ
jgi:hypothetical protein